MSASSALDKQLSAIVLRWMTRTRSPVEGSTKNPFARRAAIRQEGYPPAKRRDLEWTQEKDGAFRAPPAFARVCDLPDTDDSPAV
jgi:hypothetical protein